MGQKGYTYFGADRTGRTKPKPSRKLSLEERLREIVAEVMLVDVSEVTNSYPIKAETDLTADGLREIIELSVMIENEWELGEIFTSENEDVFKSFGKLLEFVKGKVTA